MKKLLLTSFAALMFTALAEAGLYIGGYARTGQSSAPGSLGATCGSIRGPKLV